MGTIQKQAVQNTLISYTGVIVGFINTLVLQPRMLSPEELGLTRILYSTSVLIAILFPLGLNAFSIKFFPKFRNPENGHNGYFGLLCLVALAGYAITATAVFLFKPLILTQYENSPLFVEYFSFIFPMSLFIGLISVFNVYASVLFRTSFPSFLNEVFIRIFVMVIVSLYFLKMINFEMFIFLFMGSLGIQFLFLIAFLLRIDKLSFKINWDFVRKLELRKTIQFVLLLSIAALASMAIRNNIDNLIIGSILDLEQVAIYSVAFIIASMIEVPSGALAKIADPKISDALDRNDQRMIKEVYYKSTRLLMILGGLLFVWLVANIDDLLILLPVKYHSGGTVVFIIAISAFFNMSTGMNSSIIYYSDLYKQGSILLIGLIILSIILNLVLIPVWGIEGAAIATGLSLFLFNLFKTIIIYKGFNLQPFGLYVLMVVFLITSCLVISYYLPVMTSPLLNIPLKCLVAGAVYIAGIYFSGIANEAVQFGKGIWKTLSGKKE